MKEASVMARPTLRSRPIESIDRHRAERGQLLAIFALAMVGLIGMIGLIIDGGDTALQRRDQQNVADAAAMAAGYAYVNEQDETAAAKSVAAANGYADGSNNTTVTVLSLSDRITVNVTRPHRNFFSGALGFASWDVTTTASVTAGPIVAAYGLMPIIFNQVAWEANRDPSNPISFGEPPSGSADIPITTTEFNWTLFCTANGTGCNGNTSTIGEWILADGVSTTVALSDTINPQNAGAHTELYSALFGAIGESFPVAIVDDSGQLTGFALFHLTGTSGGSTKQISGWFDETLDAPQFKVLHGHGSSPGLSGKLGVELID
jgi:Flp pilus assembly protein TadG